ncbi:hypothetical protein [Pendulispora albinea]|uniref:Uncharacterized protein n=1 Tax=Pendulispora albinea TaxID=2741071 RepID=A0ABZ2LT68_9BACT
MNRLSKPAHGAIPGAMWPERAGVCVMAAAILPLVHALGCGPARGASSPARDTARGAILTVAKAVSVADGVCTAAARERSDAKLAKMCADAYDAARPALLAAESGVDAWENGQRQRVACATTDAAVALRNLGDALARVGVSLPPVLSDALSLSRGLEEVCHGG